MEGTRKWLGKVAGSLLATILVVTPLLFAEVKNMETLGQAQARGPSAPSPTKEQAGVIAERIASRFPLGNFAPSLEMRENADFLLTPAILMQEVLNEEVVITYPTE